MPYTITETCTGCTACVRKCPVNAISGRRKQPHQIDPLACIECGACGRICASESILDERGQVAERLKPDQWLKPAWIYPACVECRICVMTCPTGAINLARYHHKRVALKPTYPFLQRAINCIGCGFCAESCPTGAIRMAERLPVMEAEAVL